MGREEASPLERRSKRSRTGEGIFNNTMHMETSDEVFDDGFETQARRGFLGGNQGQERQKQQEGNGGGNDRGGRRPTWRQKLPNVTGASNDKGFAAPVDLFVFNVNNDVTEEAIKSHMKDAKELEVIECVKVSHEEARTKSFRVKIKAEDYDKAMSSETWPYRVRVRPYKHFKQRREDGGQFNVGAGASGRSADRRDDQPQH